MEGVPLVDGRLGAFYEKLGQLYLLKYSMALPRNTVAVNHRYSLHLPCFSCSQPTNNIVVSMRKIAFSPRCQNQVLLPLPLSMLLIFVLLLLQLLLLLLLWLLPLLLLLLLLLLLVISSFLYLLPDSVSPNPVNTVLLPPRLTSLPQWLTTAISTLILLVWLRCYHLDFHIIIWIT